LAPSVTRRRIELGRRLAASLGGDSVVVAAPDHPLVMRSVDLLVGGSAGVTAVMMYTAEERRLPALFEARLALNMIALPPHTSFVRLVGDDDPGVGNTAFAASVEFGRRGTVTELAGLVLNPPKSRGEDRAEKAQKLSLNRFLDTYRLAKILRRGYDVDANTRKDGRASRIPERDRIGERVEAAFFSAKPTVAAVNDLTLSEADRWYGIVDGEAVPLDGTANALILPEYPEVIGDPDKALRAAAFAGWVMAPANSSRSLEDVADLIERFARLK
jgi:hypothetical protein